MNPGQLSRDNSRRVRTHEKKSGETVRRLGTIIQTIFVPNKDAAFASPFGNGPMRVGTQGLFRPCLKTFVAPFLLARLSASLCLLKIYITRKNVRAIDSRKQGCVITIVLDFSNNNALIVNHSICTYSQDAI